jgi:hypothetical protein
VRYHAVRALVGRDMRRSLRYITPLISVAVEGGEGSVRRYEKCQNFLSLESDREYGREVAQMAPNIQPITARTARYRSGSARAPNGPW